MALSLRRMMWSLILWTAASATASFAAPLPPEKSDDLEVEIASIGGTDGGLFGATVKFTNRATKSITLIKPRDGSEHCWIHPHYKFTIVDRDGKTLPFGGWCGMFGAPYTGTEWPKDYLLTIPAGKSVEVSASITGPVQPNTPYSLQFEYLFDPPADRTDANGLGSHNVWRGKAVSEVKLFTITDAGTQTLSIGKQK